MKSTHVKLLLVILIISFCAMPCFAAGRRAFRVDFPYFDAIYDDFFTDNNLGGYKANRTDAPQDSGKSVENDISIPNNQVITNTQPAGVVLNIDKAYFSLFINSFHECDFYLDGIRSLNDFDYSLCICVSNSGPVIKFRLEETI